MRENHSRHIETQLLRRAAATQTKKNVVEQRQRRELGVGEASPEEAQSASANDINEFGWSFRSRTTTVGPVRIFDEFGTAGSSFDDRFAAAFEVSAISQPSIIQRMMDPVGAIP
jgi:hypothetical protein